MSHPTAHQPARLSWPVGFWGMTLQTQICLAVGAWCQATGKTRADLARKLLPTHKGNGAVVALTRWLSGTRPSDEHLQALADETGYTFREVTAPREKK